MADSSSKVQDGKKPSGPKPPTGPDISDAQHKADQVVSLLHSALFSHPKADPAVTAEKAGGDGSLQARDVLHDVFLGQDVDDRLGKVQQELAGLKEPVTALAHNLSQLLSDKSMDLLRTLIPAGHFLRRLEERKAEKEDLAAHTAATFFSSGPVHAFVQASTTAVYLGQALAKTPLPSTTSLLYTNSVAFPVTVLGDHARHSVYSFCASNFDHYCGGWLFHADDQETTEELVKLFGRTKNPLTTSFVMPLSTTIDNGVFYPSRDAANFARLLMLKAPSVVMLTTADRLHERETDLDPHRDWHRPFDRGSWQELAGKTSIVIGGSRADIDLPDFARRLAAKGVDVWLRDGDTKAWQRIPGKDTSGQGI